MFRNTSISFLEKTLDAYNFRHQIVSNNIANANTPGYKRQDLNFKAVFDALKTQEKINEKNTVNEKSFAVNFNKYIVTETNSSWRQDGNNVDIDKELAILAENTLRYNALVQQVSSQLSQLRVAINEGRR